MITQFSMIHVSIADPKFGYGYSLPGFDQMSNGEEHAQ